MGGGMGHKHVHDAFLTKEESQSQPFTTTSAFSFAIPQFAMTSQHFEWEMGIRVSWVWLGWTEHNSNSNPIM